MEKLKLSDLSLQNKKVLMRVDFNVPLNPDHTIADTTRIMASMTSIQYILKHGGSVILMSHLGRPDGKVSSALSLQPCVEVLQKTLKVPVAFAPDCVGDIAKQLAKNLHPGELLLLENLRFHEAEEKPTKDPSFAKQLASLGDVYVNDAFGAAHRAHSSTATIAKYFPHQAAMGFLMEREVNFLEKVIKNPKRPFYAVLGGAKISSKIGVFSSLLAKVDALFIGGGMAYTFLKILGHKIGKSICDDALLDTAKQFLDNAKKKNIPVFLPTDIVIAHTFANSAPSKTVLTTQGVPEGWIGMDIGPNTMSAWSKKLQEAATIFWNGPMGVFEFSHFSQGTFSMAKLLASLQAVTIVGGGDSVSAINTLGVKDSFTHVSTGGGASLEFIEHGHLPGIDTLSDKT